MEVIETRKMVAATLAAAIVQTTEAANREDDAVSCYFEILGILTNRYQEEAEALTPDRT